MNKFIEKIIEQIHNPSEELCQLGILILAIIGFIVNAWIATVEGESFFLFIYCAILVILFKLIGRLRFKTMAIIIIIELIFTYFLTLLVLPDVININLPF